MAALNASALSAPDTAFSAELDFLLKRRSCHRLRAPGPSDAELAQILQAGRRAPDFGQLRPYRFLAARGNGLDRLGQAMQRAAIAAGQSERIVARAPTMPHRAPLIIIVVATPRPHPHVPEFDQVLCAACTVLMMQLAARAQGYGGIWRSGWMMADRGFHRELGLSEREQIVGLLYLGTPASNDDAQPSLADPFDELSWI